MKYMVASLVGMKANPDGPGHILTCELTGQYPAEEVLKLAVAGLANVVNDTPENMFFKLALRGFV